MTIRESRDFEDLWVESSAAMLEVERVGYRPEVDTTVWEVAVHCRQPEGCHGTILAGIEYAGGGMVNHVVVSGNLALADGDRAVLKRLERSTFPVDEVRSVTLSIASDHGAKPRRRKA
jgi:hypothetical protein